MRYARLIIGLSLLVCAGLTRWGQDAGRADLQTVEFWTYAGSGSPLRTRQFWREVADVFERENPGARARLVTDINQRNYMQTFSARALGGRAPDVMIFDDNHLPALLRALVLRDVGGARATAHRPPRGRFPSTLDNKRTPNISSQSSSGGDMSPLRPAPRPRGFSSPRSARGATRSAPTPRLAAPPSPNAATRSPPPSASAHGVASTSPAAAANNGTAPPG